MNRGGTRQGAGRPAGKGKYGETFRELNLYQQRVLTYLKDAGVLSPELYSRVLELNRDYTPLNKVLDISIMNEKGNTGLGTMVKNPLKKMEGSLDKNKVTIDPIETMFLNLLHKDALHLCYVANFSQVI